MKTQLNLITACLLGNCLSDNCSLSLRKVITFSLANLTILWSFHISPPTDRPRRPSENPQIRQNRPALGHLYDQRVKNQRTKPKVAPEKQELHTGQSLDHALAKSHVLAGKNQPVKELLQHITKQYQIAIWLDRRVDKSRKIQLPDGSVRVFQTLKTIAKQLDSVVIVLPSMVVISPKDSAGNLAIQIEKSLQQAAGLPTPIGRKLLEKIPVTWDRLSKPQTIFQKLLSEIPNLQQSDFTIPHDLWDKGHFPKTPRIVLLTLLAHSFDQSLTFKRDKSRAVLSVGPTLSDSDSITLLVKSKEVRTKLRKGIKAYREKFPKLKIFSRLGTYQISGTPKEVGKLLLEARTPDFRSSKEATAGNSVFSLAYSGHSTLEVLKTLAKQTNRKLQVAKGLSEKLHTTPLQIDVKNVTFEQLVKELLKGTGCKATIDGNTIQITK